MSEGEPKPTGKVELPPADPVRVLKLDEFLKDMIYTVYGQVDVAKAHLSDKDPRMTDEALGEVTQTLNLVMEGHVDEWIS